MKPVNTAQGFTLIELLVVVSIIGMLASVLLVALSGARNKGTIAASVEYETGLRSGLYDTNPTAAQVSFAFNEGSGTTVSDEFGGTGLTLLPAGGPSMWVNSTPTGSGYALAFGGPAEKASFNSSVVIGSSATIAFWINTTATTLSMPVFSTLAGGGSLTVGITGGNPYSFTPFSGAFTASSPVNDGKWHYVVWTDSSARIAKIYVDGKAVATNASYQFAPSTSNPTYLGFDNTSYLIGAYIDNFRMYDQLLTAAEIEQQYAEGAAMHGLAFK